MTLATDPILGVAYLDVQAFRDRANIFGVRLALSNFPAPSEQGGFDPLVALLAAASREVDALCGRDFAPDALTENHTWNPSTRRIKVDSPPVLELLSYQIRLGTDTVAVFDVSDVLINNRENYLELTSLALAGSLTTQLLTLGITEPQVEIQYKSYQQIPNEVMMATGYLAADMANRGFVEGLVPAQFSKLSVGGMTTSNQRPGKFDHHIPPIVMDLLADFVRIAIA